MHKNPGLAFAELSERALALSDNAATHDRISLRNYERDTEIGAFQQERGNTQRIRFNAVVEIAPREMTSRDDVDHILSYDTITEAIDTALGEERLNLLETLAERIAELILRDSRAARVYLRIEKLDRGPFELGVEIARDRSQLSSEMKSADPVPAQVVFLGTEALESAHLERWIYRLSAAQPTAIIVVAPERVPQCPRVADPVARRRIALLAYEYAAWALAGRDGRCSVVSSRTEIDWALRNAHLAVWAPSKLVLDATDPSPADPDHPVVLAGWLRDRLQGERLIVVGADIPEGVEATGLAPDALLP